MELELMDDFFAKRADGYDRHMLDEVEGCREGYRSMAELLPSSARNLLDLGCGTGLELEAIFQKIPDIAVTGIDLSETMLKHLKAKYSEKNITLITGSYLGRDFGSEIFDSAVSFETMHHMTHEEKSSVYSALCKALKPSGIYIECDFTAASQQEEDSLYAENERLRREQNIPSGECCHFDTPCTVQNQEMLLKQAGFQTVRLSWKKGNTALFVCQK